MVCEGVPSRIAYNLSDHAAGEGWGFEAEAASTTYCWMKMLLDEPLGFTDDPDAKLLDGDGWMATPPGKSPRTVIRDFLRHVNTKVIEAIKNSYGQHITGYLPIISWFTVPAHWPLSAQSDLREAARSAGFGSLRNPVFLMTEAEAAAICVISEVQSRTGSRVGAEMGESRGDPHQAASSSGGMSAETLDGPAELSWGSPSIFKVRPIQQLTGSLLD